MDVSSSFDAIRSFSDMGLGTLYCIGDSLRWLGSQAIARFFQENDYGGPASEGLLTCASLDSAWTISMATYGFYQAIVDGQWLQGIALTGAIAIKGFDFWCARAMLKWRWMKTWVWVPSGEETVRVYKSLISGFCQPVVIATLSGSLLIHSLLEAKALGFKEGLLLLSCGVQLWKLKATCQREQGMLNQLWDRWGVRMVVLEESSLECG